MTRNFQYRRLTILTLLSAGLATALSACSLAPGYHPPAMEIPTTYKELRLWAEDEAAGAWKLAEPADTDADSVRWEMLQDSDLLALQARAVAANQDLAAARARLDQARALVDQARSARVPDVGFGLGATRQRTAGTAAGEPDGGPGVLQTTWRAQVTAAYEVDLFGRVTTSIEATEADATSEAAWVNALELVIEADVANHYFLLRQLRSEAALLEETAQSWMQTLTLARHKHAEGTVTDAVVASIETELAQTQAESRVVHRQLTLTEHALAVLLGEVPSRFALAVFPQHYAAFTVPPGLPSALLERRPDIAAAERAMAAENARIGIAKAAFFPSLTLTGAAGYESAQLSDLLHWSQRTFLLGPLVGTVINLPLFDGGRRRAGLAQAEARYRERVAQYRQIVLRAFQEVEDGLASLRLLDEQLEQLRTAKASADRAVAEARARFKAGDVEYLFVLDSERTLLAQKLAVLRTEGDRIRAAVDLVRALGGGWGAPRPAT